MLAGGRGLGKFDNGFQGGVHVGVKTPELIRDMAAKMLGHKLITKQTGAAGRICNTVAIVDAVETKVEKYFAILMDRAFGGPVIVASAQGGVTIEDIAAANPAAIIKEAVDIQTGLRPGQALSIAKKMQFSCDKATAQAAENIEALYRTFIKCDCTMVEVGRPLPPRAARRASPACEGRAAVDGRVRGPVECEWICSRARCRLQHPMPKSSRYGIYGVVWYDEARCG